MGYGVEDPILAHNGDGFRYAMGVYSSRPAIGDVTSCALRAFLTCSGTLANMYIDLIQ